MNDRQWTWSDSSTDPSGFMPYQSTSDWLSEIMRTCVDDSTVRRVLHDGAGVDVSVALRLKALQSGGNVPPQHLPAPMAPTLLEGLCDLADSRHRLLTPGLEEHADAAQAISLKSNQVCQTLVSYAALEVLDSKIMSPVRSLDVLCRPDDTMPSPVIIKLALARADLDERADYGNEHKVNPSTWEAVTHAWDRDMAHAKATAKRWSDLVVQGRMALGATEAVFL